MTYQERIDAIRVLSEILASQTGHLLEGQAFDLVTNKLIELIKGR